MTPKSSRREMITGSLNSLSSAVSFDQCKRHLFAQREREGGRWVREKGMRENRGDRERQKETLVEY